MLIFEFGTLRAQCRTWRSSSNALDAFLARLPAGWRYAVEIRNPEFLRAGVFRVPAGASMSRTFITPGRECRRLREQIAIPDSRTAELLVARALLRRGRPYEDAVRSSRLTIACRKSTSRCGGGCGN